MVTKRTLPGFIWFDGHTEFGKQFRDSLCWGPNNGYREFLLRGHKRRKELLRIEMKLKMTKKLDRIRAAYEPQK